MFEQYKLFEETREVISSPAVANELARAESIVAAMEGATLPVITISDGYDVAAMVSKLSPFIGNLLEENLIERLSATGMEWLRQDPGFPDALLVGTEAGYEIKAWYTGATEITGRFRESASLLEHRQVRVLTIAWNLSKCTSGVPLVRGVLTVDGLELARVRDAHYHKPPRYLCVEPEDTSTRTANLKQTNVHGFRFQDDNSVNEAARFLAGHRWRDALPSTDEGRGLTLDLMNRFVYRSDSNFGKLDRINHWDVEKFKRRVT